MKGDFLRPPSLFSAWRILCRRAISAVSTISRTAVGRRPGLVGLVQITAPALLEYTAELVVGICAHEDPSTWSRVRLVATAVTDFDGKTTVQAPPGDYFVFGTFDTGRNSVVWIVPITLKSGKNAIVLAMASNIPTFSK